MGFFRSAISRFSRFVMGVYCFFYHILSRAAGIALGCVGGACLLFYLYMPLMAPLDAASHLPDWNPARAQLITISSLSGVVTAQPVLDSKDNRWKLIPNGPVWGNFKVESFVNPIADRTVSDFRPSRGKAVENLRENSSKRRPAIPLAHPLGQTACPDTARRCLRWERRESETDTSPYVCRNIFAKPCR